MTSALRTVCNHYGISVRKNGEYINMTQMKQLLQTQGIDATMFNKKSKISADLAIRYNDWRKSVNTRLNDVAINEVLYMWIGKPDIMSDSKLKKLGMDTVATFSFLVTKVQFDTELQLYGKIDSFIDHGVDPHISEYFMGQTKLDFSYVHRHRYGVLIKPRKRAAVLKINRVIGQTLLNTPIDTRTPYAKLNPTTYESQPEPIWFNQSPLQLVVIVLKVYVQKNSVVRVVQLLQRG